MGFAKNVLYGAAILGALAFSEKLYMDTRMDKTYINNRTDAVARVDRYWKLPEDRRRVVDSLIANRDDSAILRELSEKAMINQGCSIPEAKSYSAPGKCTAFAEVVSQYLGNNIPDYCGDAWTVYRRHPDFRIYQIYPESIESFETIFNPLRPEISPLSVDNPSVSTGDIVTMSLPGCKDYVDHSGVVIGDVKQYPSKYYFLESRGIIRMNEINGGNIKFKLFNGSTKKIL